MWILLLIGLVLVPVAASIWARKSRPQYTATATGVGLGLVISPLSLGLYATYFTGPLGIVTGMVGLISLMFHGGPGYHIAIALGIVPTGMVVEGAAHLYVEVANALFWAPLYGALGWVIDRLRKARVAL